MKKIFLMLLVAIVVAACDTPDNAYIAPLDFQPTGEKYTDYGENPFVYTSENPVSSFGLDADGGSYSNMRRYANLGQKPPKEAVRIEEFVNYFNFDYPEPSEGNVSLHTELSSCPWNSQHALLRIAMKGKNLTSYPHSNFVLLIDVSGSMDSPDKLGILKEGFKTFVDNMSETDRIAIVTYAGKAGVLLQSTYGDEKSKIKEAIDELGAGGSTAGADGIVTAYEIAEENLIAGGNNRIILGTDGDFNVGPSSTDELVSLIESKRDKGIYLTVLGVGDGNLNDAMMEQLADKGNGTYEYVDNAKQLKKVFVYEYSKFFTVAKDAKIQVIFDATAVLKYRLIGYENRSMTEEEFEEDSTDAGEVGANQSITAFYELLLNAENMSSEGLGTIDFRYKNPDNDENIQLNYTINSDLKEFSSSSENQRFGAAVVGLGLLLKESKYKGDVSYQAVHDWADNARSFDPYGFRKEFVELVANFY